MNLFVPLNCNKEPTISKVVEKFCVNSMDNLENAGLFLPKDVMFIDFDGHNTNEQLYINRLKEKYPDTWLDTNRGTHFYFKKPTITKVRHFTKKMSTCGLVFDFVCQRYGVIKKEGVVRTGSWDYDFDKLPILPDWLLPIPNKKGDDPIDLLGLKEGDGRNASMFYFLKRVKRIRGINLQEVAQVINTMILGQQLDAEELGNIFKNASGVSGDFENIEIADSTEPHDLAKWLIEKYKVRRYKGKIWHKNGIGYVADEDLLAGELNTVKMIKQNKWKEIIFQFNITKAIRIPDDTHNHIIISNGVIHNGEYSDIDCDEFTPYYLPIFYNPEVYDEDVDKFLNWLSRDDREMRNVIEEMFGHIILTENAPHAFFLITGDGDNGKSTFLDMIAEFTKGLASYIDIKNFSNPNAIVKMCDKLVNVADDIDPDYLENSKSLKVIANGGELEVKTLYKDIDSTSITATLLFTANRAPIWKDKTHGLFRRLNIIHLDNKITDETKDPYLLEKLTTNNAKQYILRLALEGVQRFKANNMKVSYSKKAQETKTQYMIESDPMLYWLEDTGEELDGQTVSYAYQNFTNWGVNSGIKTMSIIEFGKRLRNIGYSCKQYREGDKRVRKITKT